MRGSRIYANAVAKYEEGRLLDEEKLRRIADASYPDAIRMLVDYGYGDGQAEGADAQSLLRRETERLISFIREYASDERLKAYFLLPYVYNNAKAAYKSRFAAVSQSAFYPALTDIDEAIKSGDYTSEELPAAMVAACTALDERDESTVSAAEIDRELTLAMYKDMRVLGKKLGKKTYACVAERIDRLNLLTLYRVRRVGGTEKTLSSMLIDGGSIPAPAFAMLMGRDGEGIERETDGKFEGSAARLFESGDAAAFERETEEKLSEMAHADTENMVSSGPFIGYVTAKEREIAAVKLALTLIKSGEREELIGRLKGGQNR